MPSSTVGNLAGMGSLGMSSLASVGSLSSVGDSGETLLLVEDDTRLADIIEGASWSSMDSETLTGSKILINLRWNV